MTDLKQQYFLDTLDAIRYLLPLANTFAFALVRQISLQYLIYNQMNRAGRPTRPALQSAPDPALYRSNSWISSC